MASKARNPAHSKEANHKADHLQDHRREARADRPRAGVAAGVGVIITSKKWDRAASKANFGPNGAGTVIFAAKKDVVGKVAAGGPGCSLKPKQAAENRASLGPNGAGTAIFAAKKDAVGKVAAGGPGCSLKPKQAAENRANSAPRGPFSSPTSSFAATSGAISGYSKTETWDDGITVGAADPSLKEGESPGRSHVSLE